MRHLIPGAAKLRQFEMRTRKNTRWIGAILCATFCVALATVATMWWFSPRLPIKVIDPKFQVLSARVLRRSYDTFYLGNQFVKGS
jgi:hypothetical protein